MTDAVPNTGEHLLPQAKNNTVRDTAISIAVALLLMSVGGLFTFVIRMESEAAVVSTMIETHTADIKTLEDGAKESLKFQAGTLVSMDNLQTIVKDGLVRSEKRNTSLRVRFNGHVQDRDVHK